MEQETREKQRHPLRCVRRVVGVLALCAAVGLGCFVAGRLTTPEEQTPALSAVVLESRLQEVSELATVSYVYTNMAQFESSNDFYGMKVPFTTKKFILTYDGEIKAGVDLSQSAVEVEEASVRVVLPAAEILSHSINEDSVEVFDEKTSIFNPFTVEDFTAFRQDQQAEMEARALERGLLTEAGEKAVHTVESFLAAALPEGYTLDVTCREG